MSAERKILLVVNPISGGTEKGEILETAIEISKNEGFDLRIQYTTGENDAAEIRAMVDSIRPERVIAAGGDGTITMIASAIHGTDTILGIVPAGSANGLAADFNLPTSLPEAFAVALGGSSQLIDAVSINEEISLHLSDIGLNALLIKNYESGEGRGKLAYMKEVLKTLNEHQNFDVRITTTEGVIESNVLIVIIANARKYGTGVSINPTGDMSDGFFELVVTTKLDFIETAKVLAGVTDYNPEIMQIISVKSALIECLDRNVHFQIDGEYKGEFNSFRVNIIPEYVRISTTL